MQTRCQNPVQTPFLSLADQLPFVPAGAPAAGPRTLPVGVRLASMGSLLLWLPPEGPLPDPPDPCAPLLDLLLQLLLRLNRPLIQPCRPMLSLATSCGSRTWGAGGCMESRAATAKGLVSTAAAAAATVAAAAANAAASLSGLWPLCTYRVIERRCKRRRDKQAAAAAHRERGEMC